MTVSRQDALGVAIVLAVAALLLRIGLDWGSNVDVASVGGDRVLRGDVPYRDFWTIYAPGSFYLVAALFRTFGRELGVVHASSALLAAASSVAFYALLRRVGVRPMVSTLASVAFVVALWTPSPALHTYVVPRLLLLIGFERVVHAAATRGRGPLIAAGLAFGLAAWFKHDVAAYAALGSGLALLALRVRGTPASESLRDVGAVGLSALAAVVPVVAFVAVAGGFDAWLDLIVFPLGDFRVVRGEAYPGFVPDIGGLVSALREPGNVIRLGRKLTMLSDWAQAWLPLLGFVAAGASLAHSRWGRGASLASTGSGETARAERAAIVLALACAPFYWMAAHVQQNTHVFSLGILAALALAGAARLLPRRAVVGVAGVACILGLGFALAPAARFARMQLGVGQGPARVLGIPGASDALTSQADYDVVRPLVDFLRAHVPASEPIYVGLHRHDAILIGNASLYYLADRASATRYQELHPGISDRDDVQREMIDDIVAAGVRCIVRWTPGIPNQKLDAILSSRRRELPELGSSRLDAWIGAEYEAVASHGAYEVLWRRGVARPFGRSSEELR